MPQNPLASLSLQCIGAVACQLADYIFPGSIPMSRVNWEGKSDYEFIQNYKLLQNAFNKHHVQRHVDVDRLIRAKYQDNLEFCQWLKAFFDQQGVYRPDYDPVAARAKGRGAKKVSQFLDKTASKHNSKPLPSRPRTSTRPTTTTLAVVLLLVPPPAPVDQSRKRKTSAAIQRATMSRRTQLLQMPIS